MAETIVEKATCENCGVEAREGTAFCYNCGKPLEENEETAAHTSNGSAPAVTDEARSALDDLAERLKIEEVTEEQRLAQAAAERKRARIRPRRSEVVWDPVDESGGRLFILFTLLIAVLTAAVVFIAVYWK